MRKLLYIILLLGTPLLSQETGQYDLINECIKAHIESDIDSQKYSKLFIHLMDNQIIYSDELDKFINPKIKKINKIELEYISAGEIKKLGRKGVYFLKVYPFRLDKNGKLYILIEDAHVKRNVTELIGQSSYYINYDDKNGKHTIENVIRNLY